MDARKIAERDFHDQLRQSAEYTCANSKYYHIASTSGDYWRRVFRSRCPGALVLDYCCGAGFNAIRAAEWGARVVAFDLSSTSIQTARKAAAEKGVNERIMWLVQDAEQCGLRDEQYDVIICAGVLHHLELEAAYRELARLLKPDGLLIAIEALAHNPVINLYRRWTPHLRTAWEAQHVLRRRDILQARRYFRHVDIRCFHFWTLGLVPFRERRWFRKVLAWVDRLDAVTLCVPGLRWWAWQCVIFCQGPIR